MKKIILVAALLSAAVCLPAQNKGGNKSGGINLSLWKKACTQPLDSTQTTYVNLGLFSAMHKLHGVGFNAFGSMVQNNMDGVQISGLANLAGGSMHGVQIGGISNVNGNNLAGLSVSGLVNITGNKAKGVLITGLSNIAGDNMRGLMMSGIMNITGDKAAGVQLAGLANVTGEEYDGLMMSGLLNVVGEEMNGLQLSGLANVTGGQMNGVQLGLFNFASKAKGLQIGLFNYYKEDMKGLQLGLVNANPQTKVQLMVFGGNSTKINVGARFKNKLFYTILGGGTHYLDFDDKFSAALFYRAGLELPLYRNLFVSGDLGYQHIETFRNKKVEGIPARLYALQARLNLEYRFTDKFGLFVTGGYGGSRYYNKARTYDKGVIAEAGVVLF
mgnify:FL=1